jgi:mRNA interferase HigB
MVIITKKKLVEFYELYPDSENALNDWYKIVKKADWSNFNYVKATFNTADYVGNEHFIFNIRGNNYRLITMIFFKTRTVFIRFIGTHAEYDKINVSKI